MNDYLNTQQFPEDPLSDEELAMLRDVLNSAFPAPKTSVRDRVMAQIRQERALRRRQKLRDRFVKIGSLAACAVLVTVAGIRILPALTQKSADSAAVQEDARVYTAVTTSCLADTQAASVLSTPFSAPAEEADDAAVPEAVTEEAEAPAETVPETLPETAAETVQETMAAAYDVFADAVPEAEAEVEAETEAPKKLMMASGPRCPHTAAFMNSYHAIPHELIAAVGEDLYLAWLSTVSGCGENIADFLYYMEANSMVLISDIEMLYDATDLWYLYDWDFDLLSSGDTDAVEEYYKNGGDFADMVGRMTEYRFKLDLLAETNTEMPGAVSSWSIADLVRETGITQDALTAVYEVTADSIETEYPGYAAQEYDFDAMFRYAHSAEAAEPEVPCQIAPGRHEDAMFRVNAGE